MKWADEWYQRRGVNLNDRDATLTQGSVQMIEERDDGVGDTQQVGRKNVTG